MRAALAVRHLHYRVSPRFALEIEHLDLPAGQVTALLGRSASGKSTLLSLLGRVEGSYFEPPKQYRGTIELSTSAGTLELLSKDERTLLRERIRGEKVGFVFQREGLFSGMSLLENVAWALRAQGRAHPEEAAFTALTQVQLSPEREVATLSGGERKRLALARALVLEPEVLLLDEPFTGLDPEGLASLHQVLARLKQPSRTMVMVTHQREDIDALADYLVFLDHGQVKLAGSKDTLGQALTRFFTGEMPWADKETP